MDSHNLFDHSSTSAGPSRDVDLTLYTYLHPCVVGRLPTAWLYLDSPGQAQPRRLLEAREEQKLVQRQMWRRVVEKQKSGGGAMSFEYSHTAEEEQAYQDGEDDDVHASLLGGQPRGMVRPARGRSRNSTVVSRVKSFIDGASSWITLQLT